MRRIDIPDLLTPTVDLQEFRAALDEYIASGMPIMVTQSGKTAGYFIPARKPPAQSMRKQDLAEDAFADLLDDHEMDEVIAEFEMLRKQARPSSRRATDACANV
ncbi:Uncharacterised protein [Bordetella ansorpii]|uniref:Prevent-host-death family protein n=1 Tax=Bordetella ansorpii TaxID=288768 RepID=A0A157SJF1_9BORD|nr:type II toxin-antitoxin system Phd/YefM family antitoxin [Bordetella ansorpii]SAI70381.1 Uncharacterised protein [Bordetella ansorpii]